MTEYSLLKEGIYRKGYLREEQIWEIFLKVFNKYESIKVASYKYGLIYSILQCLQSNRNQNRFTFKDLFYQFTSIYWELIVKHQLYQILPKNLSSIYKILLEFVIAHPNYRNGDFDELSKNSKDILINEVALKCSRNVFGALYGDSEEFFYSFNKKEKKIKLNPLFQKFINDYGIIIKKVNNYEWLKFLQKKKSK